MPSITYHSLIKSAFFDIVDFATCHLKVRLRRINRYLLSRRFMNRLRDWQREEGGVGVGIVGIMLLFFDYDAHKTIIFRCLYLVGINFS